MKKPHQPPEVLMMDLGQIEDVALREETETAIKFLHEMSDRLGTIDDPLEQSFLFNLAGHLSTEKWTSRQYSDCAQLFDDYRVCLDLMGKDAKKIGMRVHTGGRLFVEMTLHSNFHALMELLKDISKLHHPGVVRPVGFGRWW